LVDLHSAKDYQIGDLLMPNSKDSGADILSPLLVILVCGSLSLAMVDKENRPAYFDIVKIAIAYTFGSTKLAEKSTNSSNRDDSDDLK
jgi:hypothetical protein